MKNEIMFLDVETTGTEEEDRIIQVAYKYHDHEANFVEYFRPIVPITIEAMSIHNITEEMVKDKPSFMGNPMHDFLQEELTEGRAVLVAHNAPFDIEFLNKELIQVPRFICTLKVAHHWDKKGELTKHNLPYLRYFLGLKFDEEINPHDALSDVLVLEKLYEFFISEGYTAEQMEAITAKPIILKKMPFGKHRGEEFKDIPRDYIIWGLKNMDKMDENLEATFKYWVNKGV